MKLTYTAAAEKTTCDACNKRPGDPMVVAVVGCEGTKFAGVRLPANSLLCDDCGCCFKAA